MRKFLFKAVTSKPVLSKAEGTGDLPKLDIKKLGSPPVLLVGSFYYFH